MTTPNIEELRGLAEAWRDYKVNNLGSTAEHIGMLFTHKRNFEKATTPDAIIALLDALQSQAERIKELSLQVVSAFGQAQEALEERDTLRAQLAALQVDDELPELPEAFYSKNRRAYEDSYSSNNMQAYARQAQTMVRASLAQEQESLMEELQISEIGNEVKARELEALRAKMVPLEKDAARWQYAMGWETKEFAVCMRDEMSWTPIKTSGPLDAAMGITGEPK